VLSASSATAHGTGTWLGPLPLLSTSARHGHQIRCTPVYLATMSLVGGHLLQWSVAVPPYSRPRAVR
jgi:hypothetical protein